MRVTNAVIREYVPADELAWLRCRALAFLSTSYFDDVVRAKPTYKQPSIELVASQDDDLVGILDLAIYGDFVTIETVAVHPDFPRTGIGSALLTEAIRRVPKSLALIDAWTREDEAANGWYRSRGFTEAFRYLHVYASERGEIERAVPSTSGGIRAVSGFFHADVSDEESLRKQFRRVHVCRRYVRPLDGS